MSTRILITDDSDLDRNRLNECLVKAGYEVLQADNGASAFAMAVREHPDLIISDMEMPGMDGHQLCRSIRHHPGTANIPIILLSSRDDRGTKVRGLELGAYDYITKPLDDGEALARIRLQLELSALSNDQRSTNDLLASQQVKLRRALDAAASIQQSLIPDGLPHSLQHLDIAWRFIPLDTIGGDVFNMHRLSEEQVGIYMVDVAGHDLPAAMITMSISQALGPDGGITKRILSPEEGSGFEIASPAEVFESLQREYPMDRFDRHFTLCYMLFNFKTGELRYTCAGHPPSVIVRKGGEVEVLEAGGPIIGLGTGFPCDEGSAQLEAGDRVYLYTDGPIEAMDADDVQFGEERFYQALAAVHSEPVGVALDKVLKQIDDYTHETDGDISILGLEFQKSPAD